jgi:hypothetical protein
MKPFAKRHIKRDKPLPIIPVVLYFRIERQKPLMGEGELNFGLNEPNIDRGAI